MMGPLAAQSADCGLYATQRIARLWKQRCLNEPASFQAKRDCRWNAVARRRM